MNNSRIKMSSKNQVLWTASSQKTAAFRPFTSLNPPLLTLPPELRNQILETPFFGDRVSALCKCHRPNPFQRVNYGILAANKQFHREASNILFHGAVLRLDMTQQSMDCRPPPVTKTVMPIWFWYIRDRYQDDGIDLGFLQRWQGLQKVRHVELSLPSIVKIDWLACECKLQKIFDITFCFLDGLEQKPNVARYFIICCRI